jgi:hypothetical protein
MSNNDFINEGRDQLDGIARDARGKAEAAVGTASSFDPVAFISGLGIRSRHAYIGGFASIALSFVAWGISRVKPSDDKGQSDRWGIFVGHWAPTFFALGIALKNQEKD